MKRKRLTQDVSQRARRCEIRDRRVLELTAVARQISLPARAGAERRAGDARLGGQRLHPAQMLREVRQRDARSNALMLSAYA
jgi:gamma-glutamylcysteine synthetase